MNVFVYGTLMDPATADSVLEEYEFRGDATLEGLSRVAGRYPTLAPGGTTAGRILATTDIESLDQYEGVDRDLYCRLSLPLAGGGTVECYIGDPELLGAPTEWPGTGSFAERVARYCRDQRVVVQSASAGADDTDSGPA